MTLIPQLPAWHIKGLPDDTPIVETEHTMLVHKLVSDCVNVGAPGLFTGENGLGKTNAVRRALEALDVSFLYYKTSHTPSDLEFLEDLAERLDIVFKRGHTKKKTLYRSILERLVLEPTVLFLDEVESNSVGGMRFTRHILDTNIYTCLLVVGNNEARKIMQRKEPALYSRLRGHSLHLEPMSAAEVCDVMADYHELFAKTSTRMLRKMDRERGRGLFRQWAFILEHALRDKNDPDFGDPDHITPELFDYIKVQMS